MNESNETGATPETARAGMRISRLALLVTIIAAAFAAWIIIAAQSG